MSPVLFTEIVTFQFPLPKLARATRDVGSSDIKPTRDPPEGGKNSSSAALNVAELACSRRRGSKWALITCAESGTSDSAARNHVSWFPTGVLGIVAEMKAVELDAVFVVTLGGVAWPDGLLQLAATIEIATLNTAYEARRDILRCSVLAVVAPMRGPVSRAPGR
jgi:hypothetical protein